MKICLFTLMSNNFFIAWEAFMKSFLHHNKWFDLDFVVLDDNLSPRTKQRMTDIYDNIVFKKPNYKMYKKTNFGKTIPSLRATYYKLDAFSLWDYDRVIQLDMDMICQGDMSEVFDCQEHFAACRTYRVRGDKLGADFNSGVFVVNKKFLNRSTYERLVNLACQGHSMPDQKTLNIYMREYVKFLPKKYNCEKRILLSENDEIKIKIKDMVIIHYVGAKPWADPEDLPENEKRYDILHDIWWNWHGEDISENGYEMD